MLKKGIFGQKYANKFFLASNLGFLLFSKNLQLDKLEEVDFKYDNSFLKFYSQNTHLRNFFPETCFFTKFFAIRQIWGCWFQTWQRFFEIVAQKHLSKTFLDPNLGVFVVLQNFAIRENWGC